MAVPQTRPRLSATIGGSEIDPVADLRGGEPSSGIRGSGVVIIAPMHHPTMVASVSGRGLARLKPKSGLLDLPVMPLGFVFHQRSIRHVPVVLRGVVGVLLVRRPVLEDGEEPSSIAVVLPQHVGRDVPVDGRLVSLRDHLPELLSASPASPEPFAMVPYIRASPLGEPADDNPRGQPVFGDEDPDAYSAGLPVAERVSEAFELRLGDLFLRHHAAQADRLAHLLHVVGAPIAGGEVFVEPRAILRGQGTLEVVGHDLDHLFARQPVGAHANCPFSRYSSTARRTRERARCNSTR